jgi:hypothetical protein
MIQCQTRRRAGRYAGSTYVLDIDACLGVGLGLGLATVRVVAQPCPVTPCPVVPHAVQPVAANPATVGPPGPNPQPASPAPTRVSDPLTQSLFELPAPATVPAPAPLTPTLTTASTALSSSTPTPALPPSPPFPLPTSNQPDALAPGVQRGAVNVAGNRAGDLSGLNGNPNGKAEQC